MNPAKSLAMLDPTRNYREAEALIQIRANRSYLTLKIIHCSIAAAGRDGIVSLHTETGESLVACGHNFLSKSPVTLLPNIQGLYGNPDV